jgi:hypothetical protein
VDLNPRPSALARSYTARSVVVGSGFSSLFRSVGREPGRRRELSPQNGTRRIRAPARRGGAGEPTPIRLEDQRLRCRGSRHETCLDRLRPQRRQSGPDRGTDRALGIAERHRSCERAGDAERLGRGFGRRAEARPPRCAQRGASIEDFGGPTVPPPIDDVHEVVRC